MSNSIEEQISVVRSLIENRRFGDGTLRVLESVLVSEDLESFVELRSSLRDLLRQEGLRVIHEISDKTVDHKLLIIEFFVRAFALVDDVECCLALRYEALVMRELKSTNNQWLQVSLQEWTTFAEHALENRFYSIARKACERALSCSELTAKVDTETGNLSTNVKIEKIKRLMDVASISAASRSVRAQTVEYLKRKTLQQNSVLPLVNKEEIYIGSTLFRNGIKKRNKRKLEEYRNRQEIIHLPPGTHI